MNNPSSLRDDKGRYRRPRLGDGPDRRVGGFYRSADDRPKRVIGRPLQSTEDAVINALRMAYDLADEQIDRSLRAATRLKRAGDAATGGHSDRVALQAGERLALQLASSGMAWLETLAAEPGSPLRRLATAEYQLLGRVLGLFEPSTQPAAPSPPAPAATPPSASAAPSPPAPVPPSASHLHALVDGKPPRAVEATLHAFVELGAGQLDCPFRRRGDASAGPSDFAGTIEADARLRALLLTLPDLSAYDRATWIAPVCDSHGVQLGWVELELL